MPTTIEMRQFRRLHAGAVTVVTFTDDRGLRGITVTAFVVVSLSPPRVLVCLDSASEALAGVIAANSFAVSLLGDRQEFLAERFAGRAPLVNRRFDGVPHRMTERGNPVLDDSLVWFDCVVETVEPAGDHTIVVGAVEEAAAGRASDLPLLYFDGRYTGIGSM
jgi:flavin reductase (DIM6/NTAB) family NADH-FMN oxidoreductase RutF